MDTDILYFTLAALAFGLALNLKLTLSVLQASRRERETPQALQAGEALRPVAARLLSDGSKTSIAGQGQAAVLLFLSTKCPKCSGKLRELESLVPAARNSGLALWIVSEEPAWRLRRFLAPHHLAAHAARVGLNDYKAINPTLASPSYLFVSHEGVIDAAGFLGDENWLSLREQLIPTLEQAA